MRRKKRDLSRVVKHDLFRFYIALGYDQFVQKILLFPQLDYQVHKNCQHNSILSAPRRERFYIEDNLHHRFAHVLKLALGQELACRRQKMNSIGTMKLALHLL